MNGTNNIAACAIDECRKIFLELSMFWKLSLAGFVFLLFMGAGVFVWAQNIYTANEAMQNEDIKEIKDALNKIEFLGAKADTIIFNQNEIIEYFDKMSKRKPRY